MPTNPSRRDFLKAMGALAVVAASGNFSRTVFANESRPVRPNIVFILADDMGYGDLGCYGNKKAFTPNLDRMANEGIRFNQFYTASPVCSPSRVGATTGQYPERWGIRSFLQSRANNRIVGQNDYLSLGAPTLARTLKASGYATAHFGKWHMGGGRDVYNAPVPTEYGFDVSRTNIEGMGPRFPRGDSDYAIPTSDVVDATINFLKDHPDQPCYINMWPTDVHTPHITSAAMTAKYQKLGYDKARQDFYGMLEEFDQEMGRFLKALDDLNLAEHTLVVLVGDNGPLPLLDSERTAGLRGGKGSLYEGGIREPGIVYWKGTVKPGQVNSQTVMSTIDLLPSLCTIAGVTPPADVKFDGEDLSAALLGGTPTRTRPICWEYGHTKEGYPRPPSAWDKSPTLAIREGDWKLLVNTDGTKAELYNLSGGNRFEMRNEASQNLELTARLSQTVRNWYAEIKSR